MYCGNMAHRVGAQECVGLTVLRADALRKINTGEFASLVDAFSAHDFGDIGGGHHHLNAADKETGCGPSSLP